MDYFNVGDKKIMTIDIAITNLCNIIGLAMLFSLMTVFLIKKY